MRKQNWEISHRYNTMHDKWIVKERQKERQEEVKQPAMYGDIVYWDGSKVTYITKDKWNTDLGTPLGVVVVPTNFAPDGKARFVCMHFVDVNGEIVSDKYAVSWGPTTSIDTSLTNFTMVPTTNNSDYTSTGSNGSGYLPSDSFSGNQSFVDEKAKYKETSNLIPSPYLTVDGKDTPNPEYYKEIDGNNALSDFNGLSNTETLAGLGSDYMAANAAWNYNDGLSNIKYYLPAIGELGYLVPRLNEINESLNLIDGIVFDEIYYLYSSSECSSSSVYSIVPTQGHISTRGKTYPAYPTYSCLFAIIN